MDAETEKNMAQIKADNDKAQAEALAEKQAKIAAKSAKKKGKKKPQLPTVGSCNNSDKLKTPKKRGRPAMIKKIPTRLVCSKVTPEIRDEALETISDFDDSPEVPEIVNGKKVYKRRLQGVIWNPQDPVSLKRICTTVTAMFLAQMNEPEIAAAMGVRIDVFRRWISNFPEIRQAKELGITDTRVALMNSAIRRAQGYDYFEETATRQGPQKVLKHMPGDSRLMALMLQNTFRGKIVMQPESIQNNQFNIVISNTEKNL